MTGTASWRAFAERLPSDTRVVQFISDLVFGDAASTDCVQWRNTFVAAGLVAPIYARRFDEHHVTICQELEQYERRPNDIILFHYTTWTESAAYLLEHGWPIVLMYHNVTPARFFTGIDDQIAADTGRGRDNLRLFQPITTVAIAKSDYSRQDLVDAGFSRTGSVPVRIDFEALDRNCNEHLLALLRAGGPILLTIGRIVPNKCIDDLIKIFAYYRARFAPTARLFLVGAHDVNSPYHQSLHRLIHRLGLEGSVQFTGQVSHEDRGAYYRACEAFVTMSEHEGFCVPIVEAMHIGVPAIGFASTAIPETMGSAGVLVHSKHAAAIAETIGYISKNERLRQRLIDRGRARAYTFRIEAIEAHLATLISDAVSN